MACRSGAPPYEVYAGSLTSPSKVTGELLSAIERLEVSLSEKGPSGCQISFATGRSRKSDVTDDTVAGEKRFQPGSRIVIVARAGDTAKSIFDGVITQAEYAPSSYPTQSRYYATCLDLTELMARKQITQTYKRQHEGSIARTILARYAQYGIEAEIGSLPYAVAPAENDWVPFQHATDRDHLLQMAARLGCHFYLMPGPQPLTSRAYWGPPKLKGASQKALTIDLAPNTNVKTIRFHYNGLAASVVDDRIHARRTNEHVTRIRKSATIDELAKQSGLDLPQALVGSRFLPHADGMDEGQADAAAQAAVDRSLDCVISGTGEVISQVYGDILMPFNQVDVRGPGDTYNGIYHVRNVTHIFDAENYSQQFTICREGPGGTKNTVNVSPYISS